MQISTKGRYGLRLMIELAARHADRGSVQIETLVKAQDVSPAYVHNILSILKKAGLVRAVRGPGGGYSLAKAPARITVYDVVTALEGDLDPVPCLKTSKTCPRAANCVSQELWEELSRTIRDMLASHTLAELAKRHLDHLAADVVSFDI